MLRCFIEKCPSIPAGYKDRCKILKKNKTNETHTDTIVKLSRIEETVWDNTVAQ